MNVKRHFNKNTKFIDLIWRESSDTVRFRITRLDIYATFMGNKVSHKSPIYSQIYFPHKCIQIENMYSEIYRLNRSGRGRWWRGNFNDSFDTIGGLVWGFCTYFFESELRVLLKTLSVWTIGVIANIILYQLNIISNGTFITANKCSSADSLNHVMYINRMPIYCSCP